MSKVVGILPNQSATVEQVLDRIKKDPPATLLCCGQGVDGELKMVSSPMNRMEALWIIEMARDYILRGPK